MKYHWDRKTLLSVIFLLLYCHVSDLFLMLMRYFFTVIATSWLRYSRQLEGMLLCVIARSVMLLRDVSVSEHNLNFEATYLLVIFPVRNVRLQTTKRCLSWFDKNERSKYILTTLGNFVVKCSRSKFGSVKQKTIYSWDNRHQKS